ncbi:hypothetical protein F4679DRAFT_594375 [Xylaria curta]|nr:hypothetical protein F4679DRAFT_594375 [Xylaria curta]
MSILPVKRLNMVSDPGHYRTLKPMRVRLKSTRTPSPPRPCSDEKQAAGRLAPEENPSLKNNTNDPFRQSHALEIDGTGSATRSREIAGFSPRSQYSSHLSPAPRGMCLSQSCTPATYSLAHPSAPDLRFRPHPTPKAYAPIRSASLASLVTRYRMRLRLDAEPQFKVTTQSVIKVWQGAPARCAFVSSRV